MVVYRPRARYLCGTMSDPDPDLLVFAATDAGLARLEPAPGARGLHDALDHLPSGVYSALRTYEHDRFLWLDAHILRTQRSMAAVGIAAIDEGVLRRAIHEAASAAPWPESRLRFDVLPEPIPDVPDASRIALVVAPFHPVPESFLRDGVGVALTRELRRSTPRVKTSEFIRRRRPYPLATAELYEHVMVDDDGRLLEGTSSNFVAVLDGALRFADAGVLEGITLRILRSLASDFGVPEEPTAVRESDLDRLEEAFVTSSSRILVPVVRVAGVTVGDGRPGPIGRRLRLGYEDLARREARPAID